MIKILKYVNIVLKKLILLSFIFDLLPLHAQRFGYIDSEYIMRQMPEYAEALTEVERLAKKWNKDILSQKQQLDSLERSYLEEEVLFTKEMKSTYQIRITEKEKALRDYQNRTFGYEGLLFLKRQELLKPIQEKIFEVVAKVCKEKRIQFMYDKAADYVMIYTNPRYDYSDYVLEELGYGDPADRGR